MTLLVADVVVVEYVAFVLNLLPFLSYQPKNLYPEFAFASELAATPSTSVTDATDTLPPTISVLKLPLTCFVCAANLTV